MQSRKHTNLDENQLVAEVLAGNHSAFEFLQVKYRSLVKSLIKKMIKDEDDVEDLTQETFIKAFNALQTFKPEYKFSAWIFRIASNGCIDFLRKKRFKIISLDQPINSPQSEDEQYIDVQDPDETPEEQILTKEKYKLLEKAVSELPDNYKLIIQMRHTEELEYQEIAEKLDMPIGTVKAHLFRARKQLQKNLQKYSAIFNA